MKNPPFNKPVRNFQKKKYYSNRNKAKTFKTKTSSWLDGTFAIDPQTWEVRHIPAESNKERQKPVKNTA